MDEPHSSTLVEVLSAVPDPRKACGKQYSWILLLTQIPAIAADHEQRDWVQTVTKRHGCLETRTLECSTAGADYLVWPRIAQIVRRTCERLVIKTGKHSVEVSYELTNLGFDEAQDVQLEALWRGHSPIENRKQYVHDVMLGEDQGQADCGSTPQALASVRNALIDLMRQHGWGNRVDALRHYGASVPRVLALIGACASGLRHGPAGAERNTSLNLVHQRYRGLCVGSVC